MVTGGKVNLILMIYPYLHWTKHRDIHVQKMSMKYVLVFSTVISVNPQYVYICFISLDSFHTYYFLFIFETHIINTIICVLIDI